jgi:hypothetical protein
MKYLITMTVIDERCDVRVRCRGGARRAFPHVLPEVSQMRERAQQGVLHQILGVPRVSGEPPAVGVELRPERCEQIQVAAPRRLELVLQHIGLDLLGHAVSSGPSSAL